jgi:hypothetical protein
VALNRPSGISVIWFSAPISECSRGNDAKIEPGSDVSLLALTLRRFSRRSADRSSGSSVSLFRLRSRYT